MVFEWVLLSVVVVQLALAKFTADDAHSRGHDRLLWATVVVLFGILGVVVYLLKRNDEKIPEAERPPKGLNFDSDQNEKPNPIVEIGIYLGSTFLGLVVFLPVNSSIPNMSIAGYQLSSILFMCALGIPPFAVSYLIETGNISFQ